MSIHPFLSATKEDLDQDCRPGVIKAVRLALGEEPVTMETWDTGYEDPVDVCRKKIRECSHYIGVFAYRRGWTPPALEILQKSITEAEFDWAEETKKEMAVFLPDPKAPFTRKLQTRAKNQSEADAKAQKDFLRRVMTKGTCQPFEDSTDLSLRVQRRLWMWSEDGLRGLASSSKSNQKAGAKQPQRRISEDYINQLGRKEQSRQLEDNLDIIISKPNWPNTVCFLIYGLSSYGHKQLAARLRKELEARSQPRQYQISLSPLWRQKSLARLIEVIGSSIEPNRTPTSIEALAELLKEILKDSDIILEINNIDRLDDSLPVFVEEFWRPLASALHESLQHRLIVLPTLEQKLSLDWEQYLQPPLKADAAAFDPMQLIKLSELEAFTETELILWLGKGNLVKSEDAEPLAQALIAETGGIPQSLYLKLADDSTWIQ